MTVILGRKPGGGGGTGGVTSLAKSGDSGLTGAVTLSEGDGITLTQAGNDIAVSGLSAADLTPALASSIPPRGALAETFARQLAGSAIGISSGVVKFAAIRLIEGVTYTSISFFSRNTAMISGTHQVFGIYDDDLGSSSGTPRALLRSTADDGSTAWGADTLKTLALTSQYQADRTGIFYIALLVVASTVPNIAGVAGSSTPNGVAPIVTGSSGSGLTALPNPAAALAASGNNPYAYLS